MEEKTIGVVISVGIAILMGIILVSIIADNIVTKTQLVAVSETSSFATARLAGGTINESVYFYPTKLYQSTSGWRTDTAGCGADESVIYGSVVIKNSTGSTWADGVDYILNTEGSYTLVNTLKVNSTVNNVTSLTYRYCPDDYLSESWGRSVLNMVPGFFALAIIGVALFALYLILRKEGIDL